MALHSRSDVVNATSERKRHSPSGTSAARCAASRARARRPRACAAMTDAARWPAEVSETGGGDEASARLAAEVAAAAASSIEAVAVAAVRRMKFMPRRDGRDLASTQQAPRRPARA